MGAGLGPPRAADIILVQRRRVRVVVRGLASAVVFVWRSSIVSSAASAAASVAACLRVRGGWSSHREGSKIDHSNQYASADRENDEFDHHR